MSRVKTLALLLLFPLLVACTSGKKKAVTPQPQVPLATPNQSVEEQRPTVPSHSEVEHELLTYLNELEAFNTDAIVRKTYPPLFTVINETHFREYIAAMMHSKDIMVEKYETEVTHVGEVKGFSNGTQFAQVGYRSHAKIIFLNANLYSNTPSINFLYDVLIHKYGKENIQMDVANRSLEITRNEKMVMIKEANQPWMFIGDTKEYRRYYPRILPPEVLNYLDT